MNVMHLQLSGGIGGISVLCKDINRLSNNKNYFYFIFEGGCVADEIQQDCGIVESPCEKHSAYLSGAIRFAKYCKKHNIDVIICHTGAPICRFYLIIAKMLNKNAKTILYLHANAEGYDRRDIKIIIDKKILQKAHKISDVSVAISESVKDSFVELCNFNPDKVKVVYNGTDISRYYRTEEENSTFEIIYTGRVFHSKGPDLLIKAVSKLDDDMDFHLSMIGCFENEYTEQIKNLAKKLYVYDKITFYGFKRDIPKFLSQADLFVHPARCREGFGITLIEAMSAHLPCVAFDRGAMNEIITDGYNGFLVEKLSSDDLAEAIKKCYDLYKNGGYEQMRNNAYESVQRFSIENTVKSLEELYY